MSRKYADMSGWEFPHLTVLQKYMSQKRPDGHGTHIFWLCRCECGTEFAARGDNIRYGKTQSCGCYRLQRLKEMHAERRRKKQEGEDTNERR